MFKPLGVAPPPPTKAKPSGISFSSSSSSKNNIKEKPRTLSIPMKAKKKPSVPAIFKNQQQQFKPNKPKLIFPKLSSMNITHSTRLDKSIFTTDNIRIVGQANKELIVCVLLRSNCFTSPGTSSSPGSPTRPLLLIFDQHAVHERIRLEKLRTSAFNLQTGALITRKIVPPMEYIISPGQWEQMSTMLPELERVTGLKCVLKQYQVKVDVNGQESSNDPGAEKQEAPKFLGPLTLAVSQLADCFKSFHEPGAFATFLDNALQFISNPANLLPADGLVPRPKLTPFLLEQLKSQACRGAIRFGEKLNHPSCAHMIKALTKCKQSFRCAHGRVLVKPIAYLPTKEEVMSTIVDDQCKVKCKVSPLSAEKEAAMVSEFDTLFGGTTILAEEIVPKWEDEFYEAIPSTVITVVSNNSEN